MGDEGARTGLATDLTRWLGDLSGAQRPPGASVGELAENAPNRDELNRLLTEVFGTSSLRSPKQAAEVVNSLDGRRLRWLSPRARQALIRKLLEGGSRNNTPRFSQELNALGHSTPTGASGLAQLLDGHAPRIRKS